MLILGSWYVPVLGFLFVLASLLMILVILIQKPRGGGLAGALGGGGGGAQSVFGSKTGDVLTWFTVGCFVAFLLLSIVMTYVARPSHEPEAVTPATNSSGPAGTPAAPASAPELPAAPATEKPGLPPIAPATGLDPVSTPGGGAPATQPSSKTEGSR